MKGFILIILWAKACTPVTVVIDGVVVDCYIDCACCKGGNDSCRYDKGCMEGCVHNIFGRKCKNSCPGNCYTCEQVYAKQCYTCKDTFYEKNSMCSRNCSVGCAGGSCNDDGSCECLSNFTGNKCDNCIHGLYGMFCDLNCSNTCIGRTCSRFDGTCTIGCIDGYSGYNCTDTCNSDCPTCQQYDKTHCTSCYDEYTGPSCRCPPNCACEADSDQCNSCENMYSNPGYKCQCHTKFCIMNNCNVCINNTHYVHEGLNSCCPCPTSCKDAVCSSRYQCLNGCVDSMYGNDCSKKCADIHIMCISCSQNEGRCTYCDERFYSDVNGNCIACKATCIDNECEGSSGRCIAGCVEGYWGSQCENSCDLICRTCDRMTGKCNGCVYSFLYGPYCNLSCSSSCINSECDMIGECAIGCKEGYTGVTCTQQVTTAASGVSVGLTIAIGIIGMCVGLAAAWVISSFLKRRLKNNKASDAAIEGPRPFETCPSDTDASNAYEMLDAEQIAATRQQEYVML